VFESHLMRSALSECGKVSAHELLVMHDVGPGSSIAGKPKPAQAVSSLGSQKRLS
jgi:hypothetical protein